MSKETPNIIFKCKYYKPKDKYKEETNDKEINKREFLSCTGSYNYVSYVDSGADRELPKDYTEYVGNKEKSCGVFNQDGILNDEQKRDLREQLRNTQSCIWDCIISFEENFGDKYCRDYDQAYTFIKSELPKFFKRAGLNKDNMVWYAGLHENTENNHIHISFFEKEPMFYSKGKLVYHNGKIDKEVLKDSRLIFERKLTNKTAEIVALRKDLYEHHKINLSRFELTKLMKKKLLAIYREIPPTGRISYDSESMKSLKKRIDETTEFILYANPQTKKSYLDFKLKIIEYKSWEQDQRKEVPEKYQVSIYEKDFLRRAGNLTIQTALAIGKIHDQIERMETRNRMDKAYKKSLRKKQLDRLLYLLDYYAKCDQQEIDNFRRWCEHRDRYAKHQDYLNNCKDSDFEM